MTRERIKQLADRYRAMFQHHELTTLAETPQIKAYRLAKPGTRVMSATIVAGPDGVTITGDVRFGDRNVLHAEGKSLGWFASEGLHESTDYLADKFRAPMVWDEDYACETVAEWAEDRPDLADDLEDLDWSSEEAVLDFTWTHFDDGVDRVHSIPAVAMLCVVQETFARLYAAPDDMEVRP